MELRVEEDGESERSLVMKEIGVAPSGNITPRESGQTSVWSFITRTHEEPTQEEKQMTVEIPSTKEEERPAGASSHADDHWDGILWYRTQRNVRRLQARIVKATQEKRWGKVKALQRLLTHSFSGKALAVRRVTENQGKNTPGVDKVIWNTPQKKINAIYSLRQRDYHPQPLRRIYIPKKNGKKRALGIPIRAVHYPSFQAMFGIPCVLLLVDQNLRSTFIDLLYHVFSLRASSATLPMSLSRLAQLLDDVWSEGNPAWAMRMSTDALQNPRVTPIGNGRDIDIEQFGCGKGRVASIASLSARTESRPLWAGEGNGVGSTNPIDFAGGKAASQPWTQPLFIEQGRDLGRRLGWRPLPHTLDDVWARLAFFPRHLVPWNGKSRQGLSLPANSHIDDIAALGERHILDQPPHELLTLHKSRRRGVPDGRQIMGQPTDLLALRCREQQGGWFGQELVLSFQLFHLRQLLVPLPFQAPGHETVVGVDGFVATAGQVRFILRPLNLTLPLVIDLPGSGFHLVQCREGHFQMCRLDGLQNAGDHRLINAVSPHGLAGACGQLRMELMTFIHQHRAIALIANAHASATGAAQDDPLQERRSLAYRSSVLFCSPGPVVIELPLVVQKLLPGDVAGMGIQQDNGPIFLRETTRSHFDPWLFSEQEAASEIGPPIDIGPGIQGTVQDVQHSLMAETTPDQFIGPLASPPPRRKTQVLPGEGTHYGESRGRLLKKRKDQTNSFLHGLIWIQHNPAHRIVDQPDRQAKPQLPLLGFGHFSTLQAALQPMKLSLRHAALESEQKPVVMRSRIIDPFVINDQGIGQRTNFQQPIPIAAGSCQARHLQAEHGPNMSQTNLGHQPLKAIATNGGRAGLPLVLVHHLDRSLRPPQVGRALDQVILPGRTAGIFSNLEKGRLPHIDDREPIKMIRTDFLRRCSIQHRLPPIRHLSQSSLPPSTLIEPANQSHEYADRGREQATPGCAALAHQKKTGARPCANLLGEHRPHKTRLPVSYLISLWKRVEVSLLLDELSHLPQSFKREQGWFCGAGIGLRRS